LSTRTKFAAVILLLGVASLIYGFVSTDDELGLEISSKPSTATAALTEVASLAPVKPAVTIASDSSEEINIYEDEQI
jgi:hypothetical protein